jgi:hypothetical protein
MAIHSDDDSSSIEDVSTTTEEVLDSPQVNILVRPPPPFYNSVVVPIATTQEVLYDPVSLGRGALTTPSFTAASVHANQAGSPYPAGSAGPAETQNFGSIVR